MRSATTTDAAICSLVPAKKYSPKTRYDAEDEEIVDQVYRYDLDLDSIWKDGLEDGLRGIYFSLVDADGVQQSNEAVYLPNPAEGKKETAGPSDAAPYVPPYVRPVQPSAPTESGEPVLEAHEGCPAAGFADVDPHAWYHEFVDYAVSRGLMKGTSDAAFEPDAPATRAMLVTILHRLEGEPGADGASPFADVPEGRWYTEAVIWANGNGIAEGYGDGHFGPGDTVTREQFAAILYRYAKWKGYDVSGSADLSGYADAADISPWVLEAMKWANAAGLITGRTETALGPAGKATCAETAAILMRFLEDVV